MNDKDFKILFSQEKIEKRIKILAQEIDEKYGDQPLTFICVLKGAVVFYVKLLEYLKNKNVELDFVQVKSYEGTETTGQVKFVKDTSLDLENKIVILVEDIIDTGITAKFLYEHFLTKKPKDLLMCSLLQKPDKLQVDLKLPTLIGFNIPNKFIIGFGLDLDERYRNLNDILVLKD
ncbi:MAG: hypoxanthine phosphoribosyltransferase [Clostridia bacterium]|nr:hypoxanthine phosphoribosyltransferase [Clostridia bacterium]